MLQVCNLHLNAFNIIVLRRVWGKDPVASGSADFFAMILISHVAAGKFMQHMSYYVALRFPSASCNIVRFAHAIHFGHPISQSFIHAFWHSVY